jgi:hypothetical protein
MKRALSYLLFITLLFQGCVKETSWTYSDTLAPVMVVDAILTDEVKSHEVKLLYSNTALNQSPSMATGATVLISDADSAWILVSDTLNPGVYHTPSWFVAKTGKYYTLQIFHHEKVYTARAGMTPGQFFKEVQCAKNEDNGLYYVDWVANAFNATGPAMWELLIDWSEVPGYEGLDSLENHARMLFYTLPTLDVSEIFAPRMESVFFPAGTIITERRYSLSPEHAEFARELLLETNWTGGLFTVAPASVSSNLSGGALGFFGVCAVNEVSVIVTP